MIWSIVSSLEVVYVVVLSFWIILEKRSPMATFAWIFALALLPYLGFVIYLVLGPRRLMRKRIRHAKARAAVRELGGTPSRDLAAPFRLQMCTLALRSSGIALASAREVRVLSGGKECFAEIETAIRAAKHHVHVLYYIFESDQTGTRIMNALVERARAGVKVRLLTDGVGTTLSRKFLRPLRDAGGEVAVFNPFSLGRWLPRVNMRNHRKIVVCDGDIGFLGGINIGDEYNEEVSKKEAFRDTHLLVAGSCVRDLQFTFMEDWLFSTDKTLKDKLLFPDRREAEPELVQIVPSGPDHEWESIHNVFFTAITQADEHVQITTPYFVPDEAIRVALCAAALRGLEVELLVPHKSDSRIVSAAARSYYDELLRAGVNIFEYPKMIHAKTMVVDRKLAIVGSANMDNRSFRLNFEVTAMMYTKSAVLRLLELFDEDKARSNKITERSRNRLSATARVGEATARLLSPIL